MANEKYSLWDAILVLCGLVVIVPAMVAGLVIILLPFSILVAWIRVTLWDWFAVPYLHLPHIPLWAMFGISLLINTFCLSKATIKDAPKPDWKDEMRALFFNVTVWFMALGLGYVTHVYLLK